MKRSKGVKLWYLNSKLCYAQVKRLKIVSLEIKTNYVMGKSKVKIMISIS